MDDLQWVKDIPVNKEPDFVLDMDNSINEQDDFEWARGENKWDNLINSMEILANDRKSAPEIGDWKYWRRRDFKIWLGETSPDEALKLKQAAESRGYHKGLQFLDNSIIDSLYITIDRNYSKKEDRVILGFMGCSKEPDQWYNRLPEDSKRHKLCEKVGDGNPFSTEYRIKPERLEYDRKWFDDKVAQELFPFD